MTPYVILAIVLVDAGILLLQQWDIRKGGFRW